jgi:catechol 2,3-dioxygenase-like lactoylglutathione lyase family enzyme
MQLPFLLISGADTMLDLMLRFFSAILGMNLRDHHDIPFALPLLFFIFLGFIVTMTVLHFIGNEEQEDLE